MSRFDGKKLLVLGSNVGASDMVRYARNNGATVSVADWYPTDRSEAKQLADEALLLSTADVESLCEYVRANSVDGVFAGISEFNLLRAMEVAQRCELPFYCTRAQWDSVEHKDKFRALCVKHSVPCPLTYHTGDADRIDYYSIEYPVVLKPVDGSSSSGVHICSSETELRGYLADSVAVSQSKKVIVEQFVKGDEFTAHYVIHKGRARLVCMDNRYPVAVHEGKVTTIPVARIFPSLFIEPFMKQVDPAMVRLCEGLGMEEGVLFIQGLYDVDSDSFAVFEAGLRSAGEAPNRFLADVIGNNYMELLVDYALDVPSKYDLDKDDPTLGGRCCGVVSFVGIGGEVGSITGLKDAVAATPSVMDYESRYPAGSVVPDSDTLRQLAIRFVMNCKDREHMARDIAYLNEHVEMLDTEGNSMVIKMDPERVFGTK